MCPGYAGGFSLQGGSWVHKGRQANLAGSLLGGDGSPLTSLPLPLPERFSAEPFGSTGES